MTVDPFLTTLGLIASVIGAVIAWTFVYVYARPPYSWRTFEAGRHLMYFTFGIAVILTWSGIVLALQIAFGRPDWLVLVIDVGRIAIFGYVAWMLWHRLRLLIDAARRPAEAHREH